VLSRRSLLLGSLGALSLIVGWRFLAGSREATVVAILRRRLAYLDLDRAGVERFARDLIASGMIDDRKLKTAAMLGPLFFPLSRSLERDHSLAVKGAPTYQYLNDPIAHGEDRIVSQFLLSSDFFVHAEDETRTVHYLGFYEPMRNLVACGNPFARLT
jgi:hypothetical protein